jgi:lipid A disaccharide synthetase
MAAFCKELSIPTLYYISPQIWAWKQNRIKKIKKFVDRMFVILPFEEPSSSTLATILFTYFFVGPKSASQS